MDESREIAIAQTFQARSDQQENRSLSVANSEYLAPILGKLGGSFMGQANHEELGKLTPEELIRLRAFSLAQLINFDNQFFQHQQGLMTDESYSHLKWLVGNAAPSWKYFGFDQGLRPSFQAEIDRVLIEGMSASEN